MGILYRVSGLKGVVDKIPSTLGSSTTSGSTTGSGAASTTS